jgi:hypothetical protein
MLVMNLLKLEGVDTRVVQLEGVMAVKFKPLNDAPNHLSQTLQAFFGRDQVVLTIMHPALCCS